MKEESWRRDLEPAGKHLKTEGTENTGRHLGIWEALKTRGVSGVSSNVL